jgi:Family of unknown function (DUF5906)
MSRSQKWSEYKDLCEKHNVPANIRLAWKDAGLPKIVAAIERIIIENAEPIAPIVEEPIALEDEEEYGPSEPITITIAANMPKTYEEFAALPIDQQMTIDDSHIAKLMMNMESINFVFVVAEPVATVVPEPVVEVAAVVAEPVIEEVIVAAPEPVKSATVCLNPIVVEYDKLGADVQEMIEAEIAGFFDAIEMIRAFEQSNIAELYDAHEDKDSFESLFPNFADLIAEFNADNDDDWNDDTGIDLEEDSKPVPPPPRSSSASEIIFTLEETFNKSGFLKSILDCAGEVNESRFNKLIDTYEHLNSEGTQRVQYSYDNVHQFGRLRARVVEQKKDGSFEPSYDYLTGESLKRYMRADCFSSNSYDIDMVNAGPVIMSQIFEKHKISNDSIKHYVANRDEVLKMLMHDFELSRDDTKECLLAILYGSSVESVIKDHELKNSAGLEWFKQYARDMSRSLDGLFTTMVNDDANYGEMRRYAMMKANIPRDDGTKRVYKNTLISTLYRTIESKIAIAFVKEFRQMGYTITTFIADGFHISRDKSIHQGLIDVVSDSVSRNTGYNVKMIVKDFEHRPSGVPEFKQHMFERVLPYNWMKMLWQRYSFFVLSNRTYYIDMGFDIHNLTKAQLLDGYGWVRCMLKKDDEKSVSFMKLWVADNKHKKYTQAGMYAPPLRIPSDTYNFWRGFPIRLHKHVVEKSCDKMLAFIKELLKGDEEHYNYMLDWIADIIQNPCTKSDVGIMLFSVEQGSGKNTLVDILKSIIGQVYSLETCNPEDQLFGRFSKMKEHKFLTIINELSAELGHKNRDKIKNMITETDFVVDEKCKNTYMGKNWSRYLITTNNVNALHIEQSDRRFVMFECSKKFVGNTEYFVEVRKEINDLGCCLALFNFLMARKITHNLRTDRPKTDVYKMIQSNSTSPIILWLKYHCDEQIELHRESEEVLQCELFSLCKTWLQNAYPEFKMSSKKFGDTFGQLYHPNMNAKQDGLDLIGRPQNRPKLVIHYVRLLASLEQTKSI